MYVNTSTTYRNPFGLCRAGNRTYVVDRGNHRIVVETPDGSFAFGNKGSLDGEFNQPTSICHDDNEREVFVVDTLNHRIQVFGENGDYLRQWGGPKWFRYPNGIAMSSDKLVYVCDTYNHRVLVFDRLGDCIRTIGSIGDREGCFLYPNSLSIVKGILYVCDTQNGRIQLFNKVGKFLGFLNLGTFVEPRRILIQGKNIYVYDDIHILELTSRGELIRAIPVNSAVGDILKIEHLLVWSEITTHKLNSKYLI